MKVFYLNQRIMDSFTEVKGLLNFQNNQFLKQFITNSATPAAQSQSSADELNAQHQHCR